MEGVGVGDCLLSLKLCMLKHPAPMPCVPVYQDDGTSRAKGFTRTGAVRCQSDWVPADWFPRGLPD